MDHGAQEVATQSADSAGFSGGSSSGRSGRSRRLTHSERRARKRDSLQAALDRIKFLEKELSETQHFLLPCSDRESDFEAAPVDEVVEAQLLDRWERCIKPVLRAALLGHLNSPVKKSTHPERLRRNVALHWFGMDTLVSQLTPAQLRKAQKGLDAGQECWY